MTEFFSKRKYFPLGEEDVEFVEENYQNGREERFFQKEFAKDLKKINAEKVGKMKKCADLTD